jgi:hypothetical protein
MSSDFQLLDLPSQALAVQRLLSGRPAKEILACLSAHGRLAHLPTVVPGAPEVYRFESRVGLPCCFFIDREEFVFLGDNTTYTVREKGSS